MGIANLLDSAIAAVAPRMAHKRAIARQALDKLSIRRTLDAGKMDRLVRSWNARASSGEVDNLSEVQNSRQRAWDMVENSGHARKIIRTLLAHNIGTGLMPESLACRKDETAYVEFRKRAKKIWRYFDRDTAFSSKLKLGMSEVAASGEVLLRKHRKDPADPDYYVPIDLEVIACERLVEDSILPGSAMSGRFSMPPNNILYRGMEFNPDGEVIAYHIRKHHPSDPRLFVRGWMQTDRIPADEIIHWFWPDRPDSLRGKTWFAPTLLDLRDVKDYKEDEMQAALAAACVTLAVKRKMPGGNLGLATPSSEDGTDDDDNTLARMQPGMLLDLTTEESIEGFNPQRPNVNAVEFLHMLLRGVSAGFPGVKSSTVTMDYRESSFSSERSADNDCWREIEMVQDWIVESVCRPIWELVIETAVMGGKFNEVLDFRSFGLLDFNDRKRDYLDASWSGPVSKSINPVDDANASILEIENHLSNLPTECAARGLNWEENLETQAKVLKRIKELESEYGISFADPALQLATAKAMQPAGKATADNKPPETNGQANGQANSKPKRNGSANGTLLNRFASIFRN